MREGHQLKWYSARFFHAKSTTTVPPSARLMHQHSHPQALALQVQYYFLLLVVASPFTSQGQSSPCLN